MESREIIGAVFFAICGCAIMVMADYMLNDGVITGFIQGGGLGAVIGAAMAHARNNW